MTTASRLCAIILATASGAGTEDLRLAVDGKTDYAIVRPAECSPVDDYAIQELAGYLKQITGADFPLVEPDDMADGAPSIFIGLSAPALSHLGPGPLAELDDQEYVARSIGRNIFLYGKGAHGNLHAVFEFLETSLGWRWYSVFEVAVLPSTPTIRLRPFHRKRGFSFAYRKVDLQRGFDHAYQNGVNMGFDARIQLFTRLRGPDIAETYSAFVSAWPEVEGGTHSLFSYIPPDPKARGARRFDWLERRNYFETNPEFFSLWENGQRVKHRQLCFCDPELRRELTKNVLRHIEVVGDGVLLDIGAMDEPGPFCTCAGCNALEGKYQSPGGPIYDYLIELCSLLNAKHPRVRIKTLAYRRSQTQKPPVLPTGKRLPGNLVIDFAPIEDCYFADWTHPDPRIQETYADLKAWSRITSHLWAWLYPNPWGSGIDMPVGNIERLINNVRLMHQAGVEGVFTDHCMFHARGCLSELQQYLLFKLMQDIHADTDAVIEEFTDNFYGPAAPLMRQYLNELEQGRKAMTELPPDVRCSSKNYDERTFPYLTVQNIHRWQTYFDRMERSVAGGPARLLHNVRLVRRELDLAVLWKWFELRETFPDYFRDYAVYVDRITAVNETPPSPAPKWEKKDINRRPWKLGESVLTDFVTLIQAGGKEKPLPPEFEGIDPARVRTFVPKYPNNRRGRALIPDPDAAFGYAVPVSMPDLPFNFGFYQKDTKTHGARRALKAAEIEPGTYSTYKLGTVEITPACLIWFSARSWATNLQLGERLYEAGADNVWEAHVSLRFDGKTYGGTPNEALLPLKARHDYGDYRQGKTEEDLVLVDRVILVKVKRATERTER